MHGDGDGVSRAMGAVASKGSRLPTSKNCIHIFCGGRALAKEIFKSTVWHNLHVKHSKGSSDYLKLGRVDAR